MSPIFVACRVFPPKKTACFGGVSVAYCSASISDGNREGWLFVEARWCVRRQDRQRIRPVSPLSAERSTLSEHDWQATVLAELGVPRTGLVTPDSSGASAPTAGHM